MTTRPERVPDWLLERLAAGELPESRAAELRATLAAHGEEHRLAALAESNAQILVALPDRQVVAEVERRAKARQDASRRNRPLLAWSLAGACAAGLAVLLVLRSQSGTVELPLGNAPGYEGIKGDPSLRIRRQTKSGTELLDRASVVHKGDNLQIGYIASGKRFGVVASIDGRGTLTLHLPENPGPAAALERDGLHDLPHSYELDDSPAYERFVFVASDAAFTTGDVVPALRRGSPLPGSFVVFELTLKKDSR